MKKHMGYIIGALYALVGVFLIFHGMPWLIFGAAYCVLGVAWAAITYGESL